MEAPRLGSRFACITLQFNILRVWFSALSPIDHPRSLPRFECLCRFRVIMPEMERCLPTFASFWPPSTRWAASSRIAHYLPRSLQIGEAIDVFQLSVRWYGSSSAFACAIDHCTE